MSGWRGDFVLTGILLIFITHTRGSFQTQFLCPPRGALRPPTSGLSKGCCCDSQKGNQNVAEWGFLVLTFASVGAAMPQVQQASKRRRVPRPGSKKNWMDWPSPEGTGGTAAKKAWRVLRDPQNAKTSEWKRENPELYEALPPLEREVIRKQALYEDIKFNPELIPKKVFDPAEQLGATPPLGFFDPLKFSRYDDKECFRKYREMELKHGRVAMMATGGALVQPFFKFPGFEKVPSGLGAVVTPPGTLGFLLLVAIAGALEVYLQKNPVREEFSLNLRVEDDFQSNKVMYFIGDDFLANPEFFEKELNNGRFAMFAAIGIISAELVSGKNAVEQLEYMGFTMPQFS